MIRIKNKEQIKGIRSSCQLAARTLEYIRAYVQKGITTNELNDLCEKFIREHGAIPAPLNYRGFPKATCISLNEVICHGIPSDRKLVDGDILNIDVTCILDGYYGDTSHMFQVGEISEDAQHLLQTAKKCLEIGIREVKPGNHFSAIGYKIGRYALLQDCTVVWQFAGHGVGIEFHEKPSIDHIANDPHSGPVMAPGMIFTVEPMLNRGSPDAVILEDGWTAVTVDRALSAQYEHTLLVTPEGVEILTENGL